MRFHPLAALVVSLSLAGTASGAERARHELAVRLAPDSHGVAVEGRVRLPRADGEPLTDFVLHAALEVVRADPPVQEVPLAGAAGRFGLDDTGEGGVGRPRVRRWRLTGPARDGWLELAYEGAIHHPLSDPKEEYSRGFRTTPGLVGPEGVFLAGGTFWLPTFSEDLIEFALEVTAPDGWHVVSQGNGTSRGPDGVARWDSGGPMDEAYLVGGPLVRHADTAGAVETLVYLHEADEGLAARYLQATAQYLEMYRQLIGPHAYSKFALVENFWETGFGMPSFTLLGPRVIRFPFILTSSYPHEILHDWWGNSVFVDLDSGNWCEGLTAYLADHLLKEQRGQGAEYRRSTLQRYRDHVREARDFPLVEFRSRHDAATEAVGYGKTLMGFHELRLRLGDDTFRQALARFYRGHRFERASFRDVQAALEEASGEDLAWYFDQWTERAGAPELELVVRRVRRRPGGRHAVEGALVQVQEGGPFRTWVPVVVQTAEGTVREVVSVERRRQTFTLETSAVPLALHVDPEFDVFRRLDPRETPPSLSQLFGEPALVAVLPAAASADEREAWRRLAEGWATEDHAIEVVTDEELEALPTDRGAWLLGAQNRLARTLFPDQWAGVSGAGTVVLGDGDVPFVAHSTVVTRRHPAGPDRAVGWIATDVLAAVPGLGRKLPHYGKYSYLAFEGDEPTNVVKGQWPTLDSPLVADLRAERDRDEPLPRLELPPRAALAELPPVFSASELTSHVAWLAAPEREGRGIGTRGLVQATEWVAERFAEAGLTPGAGDGTFLQSFVVPEGPDGTPQEVANAIGYLPASDPQRAGESVILCAHVDHLGLGWPDVHEGDAGRIHPGADDNASGVAILVELARAFAAAGAPSRNLVFIAFTAEEAGRLGSRHYVAHPTPFPLSGVRSVVNLDTVGRLGEGSLTVLGGETATEWVHVFRGVSFVTGIPSQLAQPNLAASDHVSFIERGIPAVQLFTGPHGDYHRPGDVAERVDGAGMVKVATFVQETLAYLVARPEPLTVTIEQAAATREARRPGDAGRRVTFGSVPDFAFGGPGVRLSGVVPDSPAARAGLLPGDVLTHLDGVALADIRAFSEALKSLEPGQVVRARVERDGDAVETDVTLRAR